MLSLLCHALSVFESKTFEQELMIHRGNFSIRLYLCYGCPPFNNASNSESLSSFSCGRTGSYNCTCFVLQSKSNSCLPRSFLGIHIAQSNSFIYRCYNDMYDIYLCCLPAPLSIFGIVGEPPHVPVGLDDLRPQDVVLFVLPYGHRLQAAVELKGLRAKLQHLREGEKG